jgi:hypothetical protein
MPNIFVGGSAIKESSSIGIDKIYELEAKVLINDYALPSNEIISKCISEAGY